MSLFPEQPGGSGRPAFADRSKRLGSTVLEPVFALTAAYIGKRHANLDKLQILGCFTCDSFDLEGS
jgi:hypothetical protein